MPGTFQFDTVKVSISGTAFSGAEIWQTGFYLGHEDSHCSDPTDAMAQEIAGYWQTLFTAAASKISNQYKTERVKLSYMLDEGTTDDNRIRYYDYPAAISGSSGSQAYPPQCALVGSLRSSRAHGKASHGRMYLPGFAGGVQSDGRITGSDRDAIGLAFKTFFTSVRNMASSPGWPILVARGGIPLPLAESKYVLSVAVGNVIDTQRRRRNGLTEVYYTGTI